MLELFSLLVSGSMVLRNLALFVDYRFTLATYLLSHLKVPTIFFT